jgi:hypothetical protein
MAVILLHLLATRRHTLKCGYAINHDCNTGTSRLSVALSVVVSPVTGLQAQPAELDAKLSGQRCSSSPTARAKFAACSLCGSPATMGGALLHYVPLCFTPTLQALGTFVPVGSHFKRLSTPQLVWHASARHARLGFFARTIADLLLACGARGSVHTGHVDMPQAKQGGGGSRPHNSCRMHWSSRTQRPWGEADVEFCGQAGRISTQLPVSEDGFQIPSFRRLPASCADPCPASQVYGPWTGSSQDGTTAAWQLLHAAGAGLQQDQPATQAASVLETQLASEAKQCWQLVITTQGPSLKNWRAWVWGDLQHAHLATASLHTRDFAVNTDRLIVSSRPSN